VKQSSEDGESMRAYKTSATVKEQGDIQLVGVPFAPGTEVEVTISPKQSSCEAVDSQVIIAARDRMRELFQSIKGFRNTPRISREELDRL
jgi:hypothetical protein